jgi:hypothetical protein
LHSEEAPYNCRAAAAKPLKKHVALGSYVNADVISEKIYSKVVVVS